MSRYLKKWGFTPQRPLTKSFKKDPKKVTKFLIEDYPLIKQRAKKEKANIYFLDEMGINNNTHSFLRGYGKKGDKSRQPILTKSNKRVGTNMISVINNSGNFRFMVFEENMNIELFLKFLRQLIKNQDKKIFLILDNLKVHHAKKVQKWQKQHKDKIEFFFLPAYSPELNPDELVNQDVKANALKHKLIHTKSELSKMVRSYLYSLQKDKQKIRNFFKKESVRYAA
jgi:transposase